MVVCVKTSSRGGKGGWGTGRQCNPMIRAHFRLSLYPFFGRGQEAVEMNSDYIEPQQQQQRSYSSLLSGPPGSRRERLRSFARSTTQVLRQEINRYYAQRWDDGMATPTSSRSALPTSTQESFAIPRQRTISSTSAMSLPEGQGNLKPQCLLFPTYATRAEDENGAPVWKIKLAGWTFANTESGRLRKWALGKYDMECV